MTPVETPVTVTALIRRLAERHLSSGPFPQRHIVTEREIAGAAEG